MECKQIQDLLHDYFDGVLESGIEDSIEEHLSFCEKCRKTYEDMEAVITLLRFSSKPQKMPSGEFFNTVFSRHFPSPNPRTATDQSKTPPPPHPLSRILRDLWRSPSLSMNLARAAAFTIMGFLIAVFSPHFLESIGPGARNLTSTQPLDKISTQSPVPNGNHEIQISTQTPAASVTDSGKTALITGPSVIDKSHKSSLEAALVEAEKNQKSASLAMAGKTGQIDVMDGELIYTVPPPPSSAEQGNPQLLLVATRDRQLDVMESIQKLKMNLHLSGESRFIPEIHKIESYVADIAAATERTDSTYLTNLRVFQEAEQCLVEKKYTCALQNYDEVAKQAPGSLMSFLALFQTANLNYEQLGDYRSALAEYQKCLEQYPAQYITDEKKDIILNRIDILTRNSMDNWTPLQFYIQSKTTPSSIAIPKLKEILERYPTCSLILDTIESLSTRILSDEEVESATVEDIISFFQQCRERYEARHIKQMLQYKTAEIFQYRLMNCPQAILEYTRVVEMDPQSKLAEQAKGKIHSLYRRGINLR
jgi:tetratricopeptide (TPR) repeat protein